jgi:hypothetical protein
MKTALLISMVAFAVNALADMPVVFPDYKKFDQLGGRNFLISSTIPGEFKTPEGVVGAMLLLGNQVKDKNLTAPFWPDAIKGSSQFEGAQPLGSYYRGARVEGTIFIIGFSADAMRYLNNTAGIEQSVKGALKATIMKNFPDIDRIEYEIDGKIVAD